MKYLKLFLIVFLIPTGVIGQKGYIVTDSSAIFGLKIQNAPDREYSKICHVIRTNDTLTFTPSDIKEFSTGNRIFESKTISDNDGNTKKVFLERLAKGDITLFYYRSIDNKYFLISKDSSELIKIPKYDKGNKKNYKSILKEFTNNCERTNDNLRLVHYTKQSMKELIEKHNICDDKPFRFTRFGLVFGLSVSKLNPAFSKSFDYAGNFSYNYKELFSIGMFIDKPIYSTNLSYYLSIYYNKISDSYSKVLDDSKLDFEYKSQSLHMPIMLRYSLPKKISPFFNGGAIIRYDFKNDGNIFFSDGIQKVEVASAPSKSVGVGFIAGAGLEIKFTNKNSINFEFRYENQRVIGKKVEETMLFNRTGFQLLTGINF
ncbi:MAG: outer membrane beta-barrel protein [Bacteroidales bacterium]